ncbi:hypothetical protein KM043_004018 [Ampulex compressa]|nr:hypothetical protein KM043_004018 [Ampulex compressa]
MGPGVGYEHVYLRVGQSVGPRHDPRGGRPRGTEREAERDRERGIETEEWTGTIPPCRDTREILRGDRHGILVTRYFAPIPGRLAVDSSAPPSDPPLVAHKSARKSSPRKWDSRGCRRTNDELTAFEERVASQIRSNFAP